MLLPATTPSHLTAGPMLSSPGTAQLLPLMSTSTSTVKKPPTKLKPTVTPPGSPTPHQHYGLATIPLAPPPLTGRLTKSKSTTTSAHLLKSKPTFPLAESQKALLPNSAQKING